MRNILLASTLAVVVLGASQAASRAASFQPTAPCQLPVMKVYRIKPGFCPQALVYMIPNAVGGGGCCGCDCGPYGIPPIYASGQNVLVRQTPDVQEEITEFLTDLEALVEPKKAR